MMATSLQFALRESLDELLHHLNFRDLLLFNFGCLWTYGFNFVAVTSC